MFNGWQRMYHGAQPVACVIAQTQTAVLSQLRPFTTSGMQRDRESEIAMGNLHTRARPQVRDGYATDCSEWPQEAQMQVAKSHGKVP